MDVAYTDWSAVAQNAATPALNALYSAASPSDAYASAGEGFADFGIDYVHHYIVLFSNGLPNIDWSGIDAALSGTGFTVVHVQVANSLATLTNALTAAYEGVKAAGITDLSAISTNPQFTGVILKGPSILDDASAQSAVLSAVRSRVATNLTIGFAYAPKTVLLEGRQNDTPPILGGSRLSTVDFPSACTSGFAMANNDAFYMLTAAHCANYGNNVQFSNGAGTELGENSWTNTLYGGNPKLDATLIHVDSVGFFYVGGWQAQYSTANTISVAGVQPWAEGEMGCVSGSVIALRSN